MEKPLVRRATRTLNLVKPAPRKCAINGFTNSTVSTEIMTPPEMINQTQVICQSETNTLTEAVISEKENRPIGRRATRGLKLDKPAPRASKINKEDIMQDNDCLPYTEETREQQHGVTAEQNASLLRKSAEAKAAVLIEEALSGMDGKSHQPHHIHRQTRQLSQVSDDSGVGDMTSYSRQSSLLESLGDTHDDLDWDDVDDCPGTTFTLGTKQMECLATVVNQVQPFSSLMTNGDIHEKDINANNVGKVGMKMGQKNSYQKNCHGTRSFQNSHQNFTRSYSVPAKLSNGYDNYNNNNSVTRETEFWEDGADFAVNNFKSLSFSSNTIVQRYSEITVNDFTGNEFEQYDEENNIISREHYAQSVVIPKSDANSIKSDAKPPKSDVKPPKSDVKPPKSNVKPPKSDVKPPKSGTNLEMNDNESLERGAKTVEVYESRKTFNDKGRLTEQKTKDDAETVGSMYEFLSENKPSHDYVPFDLDIIESELDFMRDDLEMSESLNSLNSKSLENVNKKTNVAILREPLHPHSTQQDIWAAEECMTTGFNSAKGRRGMFRYYRSCKMDEVEENSMSLIQYTPMELLQLGAREISHQKPETWSYLSKIFPDICFNKASLFDAEKYLLEREYVVTVGNVMGDNRRR